MRTGTYPWHYRVMTQDLIESLVATHTATDDGVYDIDGDDSYIDWSTVDGDRRCIELSNDGDTAQVWMTREQVRELHHRLTITLLAEQ